MHKILTVTVGIPAYNEELNISLLLKNIFKQKMDNWRLSRVIVVSDKSTDLTNQIVKSFGSSVELIKNKTRIGAALSQNVILRKCKSDVLVLFNADVQPIGVNFISNLAKNFHKDKKIGIVGAKTKPLPSVTFWERVINSSVIFKTSLYEKINNGNTLYLCHGRARAFSKGFIKQFRWKATFGEDAYSYLSCLSAGYHFKYEPTATVVYRSPQNLEDHLKQSIRFLKGNKKEKEYFDSKLAKNAYFIPKYMFVKLALRHLTKDPFYFLIYILVLAFAHLRSFQAQKMNISWESSITSKRLVVSKD